MMRVRQSVAVRRFIAEVWHGLGLDWESEMGVRDDSDSDGRGSVCECLSGTRVVEVYLTFLPSLKVTLYHNCPLS